MLRTLLSTEGPRLHIVGADDSVRPVPLSFRASARTGVGIRIPLCTCTLKAARRGRRPRLPVPLSFRRGRRPRRPVSARLLYRSVGADDSVRPVSLSLRASARTGVGIRFPLPPSAREVAARSADGGSDIARQFLSPSRLPDTPPPGALQRGAAALTGRRTPRAFVPLRSTAGRRPLRAVQRTCPIGRLALRPPFIRRRFRLPRSGAKHPARYAVRPPALSKATGIVPPIDLSRDGAVGIPNCTFPDMTKPRDFRRGVSCWRYLSSQAVSSQVLSAEASLTDLSRDGAAGIPNSLFPA